MFCLKIAFDLLGVVCLLFINRFLTHALNNRKFGLLRCSLSSLLKLSIFIKQKMKPCYTQKILKGQIKLYNLSFFIKSLIFKVFILLFGIMLGGCDSSAFSSFIPQDILIEVSPPFVNSDIQSYRFRFEQFTHLSLESPSPLEGNEEVVDFDLGPDLVLISWRFIDDFEVELELERVVNAPYGEHEVSLTLMNRFGEFAGKGVLFVF